MPQINIHTTAEFERMLRRLMQSRGVKTKSEAIRLAVRECLERGNTARAVDYTQWIGLATRGPQNPSPRFRSDEDLWGPG